MGLCAAPFPFLDDGQGLPQGNNIVVPGCGLAKGLHVRAQHACEFPSRSRCESQTLNRLRAMRQLHSSASTLTSNLERRPEASLRHSYLGPVPAPKPMNVDQVSIPRDFIPVF